MIREIGKFLPEAMLISLDHDLNPQPDSASDPGTGLEVAEYLAKLKPVCPVVLHSSNFERVGPIGQDWIETSWLKKIRDILLKNK